MHTPISPIQPQAPAADFTGIDALFAPQKQGPRGSDLHPIRAEYDVPAFSYELDPSRAVEAIVGEHVKFVQVRGVPGSTWELARRPAASKAQLQHDSSRLIPDVPGLYIVACTLPGGWRREITIAAFPPESLDAVTYPPPMALERRMRLRAIVHDPNTTRESIAAGLEQGATDLATLAGYVGKKRGAFRLESYK